jgi:hypothetical protein
MSARRAVTLGVVGWVVGWVVVAAAGATLTWVVISRAGTGVSGGLEAVPGATTTGAPGETVTGSTLSPDPTTGGGDGTGGTDGTPATDSPVSRTWQGAAGVVSVSCRGAVISRDSAFAYSGYDMDDNDDEGTDRVRVEFENDDGRIRVEAECVDGVPVFSEDHSGEG